MKAYVLRGIDKLDYTDVPRPVPGPGQVLVSVKAAGICGSDIPRIFVNGTYHFPTIPGHEFSGIVECAGDRDSEKLIEKRVGVFPLIPCMKCPACLNRQYEMCMNYNYLGSRCDGGFAEYVAVPSRNVIEIPDEVSFEEAAMLEPSSVGIHALGRVDMKDVKTAAVFGPGTIGLLIAQWLRILGIRDIFIAGKNNGQRRMAATLGFDSFFTENAVDSILEYTDGIGADLTIDCTGYDSVLEECIMSARRGGNVLIVGNPHSDVSLEKNIYWQILRRQLKVCGTWNSSFIPDDSDDDWRKTIRAVKAGELRPAAQITHRLPFDRLKDGLEIMRNKTEYYNKIMVVEKA